MTAAVTGLYLITYGVYFLFGTAGTPIISARATLGGVQIQGSQSVAKAPGAAGSSHINELSATMLVNVTAGQTFAVNLAQSGATAASLVATPGLFSESVYVRVTIMRIV
jgi:hypothetical protein